MPKKIKPEKFFTALVVLFFVVAVVLVFFELSSEDALATIGLDQNDTQNETGTQAPDNTKTQTKTNKTLSELCLVIDAGHGGFDSGTIGVYTDSKEADINLAVCKKLKSVFESAGAKVVMTREDDKALDGTKDSDMQARGDIICQSQVDLVLSIHMNRYIDSSVGGPQVFSYPGATVSRKLAETLQSRLNDLSKQKPRIAKEENFYILRVGNTPAVIIECGFLSNESDDKLLATDSYQQEMARTIFNGVRDFLEDTEP